MLSPNRKLLHLTTRIIPNPSKGTTGFHTPNQTTSPFRTRSKLKPPTTDQRSWKPRQNKNRTKTQSKQQTSGIPTITTKPNNTPPQKKLDNNNTKDSPTENETGPIPTPQMKHKLQKGDIDQFQDQRKKKKIKNQFQPPLEKLKTNEKIQSKWKLKWTQQHSQSKSWGNLNRKHRLPLARLEVYIWTLKWTVKDHEAHSNYSLPNLMQSPQHQEKSRLWERINSENPQG